MPTRRSIRRRSATASIGYTELLSNRLQALDATAVSLAMDNDMPIVVFDMTVPGNIARAVRGERIGTLIAGEESR